MVPVVTACDEGYMPGAIALYNSFVRNAGPGFEFVVLFNGSDDGAERLRLHGITVIHNPRVGAREFPTTRNRPTETAEVHFYRYIVPSLFRSLPRSIYIDADALILRKLQPLVDVVFSEPLAATTSHVDLNVEIVGLEQLRGTRGFITSLLVFNHAAWFAQRIYERAIAVMENKPEAVTEWRTGDQAILNYVVGRNWHELHEETTQVHAGHNTPRDHALIMHYIGTKPWQPVPAEHFSLRNPYPDHKVAARELWWRYA